MKILLPFFILFSVVLFSRGASAQATQEKKITMRLDSARFNDFVKQVESQTGYYFYYDASKFDSLTLDLDVKDLAIRDVLDQVFKGSEFEYSIDAQKRIYITQGQRIITQLVPGLFEPDLAGDNGSIAYSGPENDAKEKLLSTAESKLHEIGIKKHRITAGNSTITGYVRNAVTGEPVIGAAVFITSPSIGVTTDALGLYALTIPRGKQIVRIKSTGMRETQRQVMLYSDGKLDIEMRESVIALKEVSVKAGMDKNVVGTQMGTVKLTIKNLKQVPTVFGETDLLRTVLTLPGIKSVGENSTGLNVRGGSTDQNLIQYNDAVIYNPSHLFGFFSAFNPDVLKDVELYKSTIPAKFGGRLASVLDISSRDGNKKKFVASGGIGLITGRLTLEGPLVKDKTSFLLGGRSTYSSWLIKTLDNENFNKSSASFYDVNLHISHEINEKNSLFLTGYISDDRFRLYGDTLYTYQNQLASLKWKHTFNNRLYSVFTAAHTKYQYAMGAAGLPLNSFDLKFDINQSNFKADLSYVLHPKHTLDFGLSTIYYKLHPGSFQPKGPESLIIPDELEPEQGTESAIYIEDKFEVNPRLSITAGLRYSYYQYLGPRSVNTYVPGLPIEYIYQNGVKEYGSGKKIKSYGGPEYRASIRYSVFDNLSLKVSYNTLRQYIHLLTNTMTVSPTDIWKLSDNYVKPQIGDQISVGLYRNFRGNKIEVSLEGYYKNIQNFLDYKGGDSLIMNHNIEAAVLNTKAKAYGIEFMIKKMTGKLNGWLGYTYARTLLRAIDRESPDAPNDGNFYPSNYDKPHDFTLISNYRFSHRLSFSFNFTYSTGRPYTPPIGKYMIDGAQRVYYADRNQFRIPDYYRTDVSLNIEGNHRIKKLAHSSWTLAVYNVLGRKNPTSVYFQTVGGKVNGYQLSIFGQPIPTITYNFRF
ncbi:TonB-dependent receptor [Dyadobacter chenwenxiniae]|uniref:TonB-dependent receptor n=1 Tax=Dyadobacter chenwenxiniae TaxID=2906456 RepID=A0A9X1PHV8_9BACT|nr:TonB-dependent receptor [Dyadobacter chenwenxiniae]MCF0053065.1 TonB-dependent receptor [Dyadobacter chenwenxiniae]MCF0061547.1 TonB-dependent receptor [Dyadobacter chenwenxiniae]UON81371.1 TonB-dependent receptor [Dyadobacter chenwenxiniae]